MVYALFNDYIGCAGLRGALGDKSPGPYRSLRELSLTGLVGSDIWRPPTFVGNPGSILRRPLRLRTLTNVQSYRTAISQSRPPRRGARQARRAAGGRTSGRGGNNRRARDTFRGNARRRRLRLHADEDRDQSAA